MADRKFVVLEWLVQKLSVARKKGDRQAEGLACFDLGIYYQGAADFNQAIISYTEALAIFTEIGFRVGEGGAYGNLGIAYKSLGDFKQAIAYHNQRLRIAKELGDRAGEGRAYGNLGIAYRSLGDFKQVIAYLNEDLSIAKELGDRAGEGAAYGNLGLAYQSLGDFKQALAYHNQNLSICKEMEDPIGLAIACYNIGLVHEIFYSFSKALNYFSLSIHYFDETRRLLQAEEAWKISFRDKNKIAYTALWTALLKNGEVDEALYAAELGRTQALADILKMQYGVDEKPTIKVTIPLVMKDLPSQTVFTALEGNTISFWLLREDIGINFRQKKIENGSANSLLKSTLKQINAGTVERCENRSLDRQRSDFSSSREAVEETVQSLSFSVHSLQPLYDVLVSPIADLLQGDDLVFVPDGDFCLAPFSALSDSVRIRAIPSLTALKLIAIATDDFQSKNEALLVGDPCLKEVTHGTGESMYGQLPCAKKEVYMIGKLLQTAPLTGKNATKAEVLKRMKSVDLIHIAAHGDDASGEIALAPNPERTSQVPKEEDYILSLSDVQAVRLQARLVVLSCSHSGQGEVKSEGIVGVARAFLCAGARSVLASLWAIDDEATLMFMKRFYKHLADRKSACRALHHAMKSLRETKNYSAIKHWAPFVLIGDDVTFEFGKHEHKKNASSHGNVDDISDDSDIHPVIAVAGDDDDDDEVGYEEGKEEERGGNKHEEDEEKELEGNEDEVALEAERIDTLGLEHHENKGGDIGEGVIQAVVEDFKLEQHEREESVEEDPIKTRIYEGTVTSEGIRLHLKLGAVHLTFPPDAMSEPTPIMVHRWKCNALSPPLGEHEAVVSNVIEIYTNTVAEAFEFNKEVRLALSHSAPNLKGYELVIKRLVDAETNEWEDVDGSEDFQCPSDIVDDYSSPNDIPDSCFPVVQAGITKCSTYAVVCRLKLSPAYTITVNGGTYSHPDYPDVIIAVPKKAIPNKTKLPLQLKTNARN